MDKRATWQTEYDRPLAEGRVLETGRPKRLVLGFTRTAHKPCLEVLPMDDPGLEEVWRLFKRDALRGPGGAYCKELKKL